MVKVLCEKCKVSHSMAKQDLPEKYAKHVKAEILNVFVNNPAGCENCNN
jgi:hypothetical protein